MFTGGEDGQVKAWRLPLDGSASDVPMDEDPKTTKKRKKHEISESEKVRFKPY